MHFISWFHTKEQSYFAPAIKAFRDAGVQIIDEELKQAKSSSDDLAIPRLRKKVMCLSKAVFAFHHSPETPTKENTMKNILDNAVASAKARWDTYEKEIQQVCAEVEEMASGADDAGHPFYYAIWALAETANRTADEEMKAAWGDSADMARVLKNARTLKHAADILWERGA